MSSALATDRTKDPPAMPAADQVALFHRALAELCRADVPLPRALEAVAADLGGGPLADAVRRMAADVESGATIAEAYAAHADSFPALYRGLVEAGIASGDLPGVLDEIAAHAAAQAEIAARVRRALAYPAFAAAFVAVATLLLAVFVTPRLEAIQAQATTVTGADLAGPWIVRQSWSGPILAVLLAGAGVLAAAAFAMIRRPLDGATAFSSLAWRWPVLGRIRVSAQSATFAATLALLLRRRMPLGQALGLAALTCDEPRLRARVAEMADRAAEGASLGDVLSEGGVLPASLVWIVASAERRGEAPAALDDVARVCRERLSRAVDRAVLWVTPVAELAVGIVVAFVALGVLGRLSAVVDMQRMLAERN